VAHISTATCTDTAAPVDLGVMPPKKHQLADAARPAARKARRAMDVAEDAAEYDRAGRDLVQHRLGLRGCARDAAVRLGDALPAFRVLLG
jgi:hypothetical protein